MLQNWSDWKQDANGMIWYHPGYFMIAEQPNGSFGVFYAVQSIYKKTYATLSQAHKACCLWANKLSLNDDESLMCCPVETNPIVLPSSQKLQSVSWKGDVPEIKVRNRYKWQSGTRQFRIVSPNRIIYVVMETPPSRF